MQNVKEGGIRMQRRKLFTQMSSGASVREGKKLPLIAFALRGPRKQRLAGIQGLQV